MESGGETLLYLLLFVGLMAVSVILAEGIAMLMVKTTGIDIRLFSKNKGFIATFFSAVLVFMTLMVLSLLIGYFIVRW